MERDDENELRYKNLKQVLKNLMKSREEPKRIDLGGAGERWLLQDLLCKRQKITKLRLKKQKGKGMAREKQSRMKR